MIQRVKSFFALQVHHLISYQKVYANLPSRRQLTEIFLCSGTLATTTIVFKAGADSKNLWGFLVIVLISGTLRLKFFLCLLVNYISSLGTFLLRPLPIFSLRYIYILLGTLYLSHLIISSGTQL